jgi:hypothetical protein
MQKTIILALLLACGVAQGPDWVFVAAAKDEKKTDFVDTSSIRISADNIRHAWFKQIFRTHTERGTGTEAHKWLAYAEFRIAFNCTEETSHSESGTMYYDDGSYWSLPQTAPSHDWEPVAPDTLQKARMDIVCAWKPK